MRKLGGKKKDGRSDNHNHDSVIRNVSNDDAVVMRYDTRGMCTFDELIEGLFNDPVNHPSHYTQGIETLDYIMSHKMSFCQGNVIKYVTRYKLKNGLEDLKKAEFYLKRLIKELEDGEAVTD